jgi:hypothetical protein
MRTTRYILIFAYVLIFVAQDSDFRPARIDVVFGPRAMNVLSIPRN